LPTTTSFGLVTGAQMANMVGLAAARRAVLSRHGVDVDDVGLSGAPPIRVVVGEHRHVTVDVALRYLGVGRRQLTVVPADDQGRMRIDALADALEDLGSEPTIVCAQAGCVDTGAFDRLDEICTLAHRPQRWAWVHVDGAFGLWAAVSPVRRHLLAGVESADSWATDAHKWLNVPYDAGLVFTAHPDHHRASMSMQAAYLTRDDSGLRDGSDWAPESSRRARAFAVWAALRSLGRTGVADLVERCCQLAGRAAAALATEPGIEVLNEVGLNQVLVRFGSDDQTTRDVVASVQRGGVAWFGGTTWRGRAAARLSVSGWATTPEDVNRTVAATVAAYRLVRGRGGR
jgi:glutamate/tyrosine decarboxylase-like PLP-dependent enzyme